MLRTVVVPLLSAYVMFVGIAAYAWRHPVPRPGRAGAGHRRPASPARLVRHVAVNLAGGYVLFLAIVLVFHVWIAAQAGALSSAVRGGGFLAFGVAAPTFVLLSFLEGRRAR